jgi:hypothetical protein
MILLLLGSNITTQSVGFLYDSVGFFLQGVELKNAKVLLYNTLYFLSVGIAEILYSREL